MAWGTKNPPKKRGRYLVTGNGPFGPTVRLADRVEAYPEGWRWMILPDGGMGNVIAWKKCPAPHMPKNKP